MGSHAKGLQFVTLTYRMRTLGLLLAMLPLATVLHRLAAPPWQWGLLMASGLLWPQLAWLYASRAAKPAGREHWNLLADAALLGLWIALIRFNLLPSVLLVAIVAMDRISAGGWPLLLRAMLTGAATCALAAWANGFAWQPDSDMRDIVACLPLMTIYPVWLSTVTFKQSRRIREQNLQLARLNRTDALTGLANRSSLLETAEREWRHFRRHRRISSLVMLDADGFKQVNDRLGHAAGDAFLRTMAGVLHDRLRNVDTPGRLGGDEFAIVLPETELAGALVAAERIRECIEQLGQADAGLPPCTLSLGVAEIGPQHDSVEAWFKEADAALYRAKAQGRNRVCIGVAADAGPAADTVNCADHLA